jgi:surface protein
MCFKDFNFSSFLKLLQADLQRLVIGLILCLSFPLFALEGTPVQHDENSNALSVAMVSNGQGKLLQLGRYFIYSQLQNVGFIKQFAYDSATSEYIGDKNFSYSDSSANNVNVSTQVRDPGIAYIDLSNSQKETLCTSAVWDNSNSVWWVSCRSLNSSNKYILYLLKVTTTGTINYYRTDIGGGTTNNKHGYPGKQGSLILDGTQLILVGYRGSNLVSPVNTSTSYRPFIAKFNTASVPASNNTTWTSASITEFTGTDSDTSTGAYNYRAVAVTKIGSYYYSVYTHVTDGGYRVAKFDTSLTAQATNFFTSLTLPSATFGSTPTAVPTSIYYYSTNSTTLYIGGSVRKSSTDPYYGVIAAVNTTTGSPVTTCNSNGFYAFQANGSTYDTLVNDINSSSSCAGYLLATGSFYTGTNYKAYTLKLTIGSNACTADGTYGTGGIFKYVEGASDNFNMASTIDSNSGKYIVSGRQVVMASNGVFRPAGYLRSFAACNSTTQTKYLQSCSGLSIPTSGNDSTSITPTATATFTDGTNSITKSVSLSEMTCQIGVGTKNGDTFNLFAGGPATNQCWIDSARRYSCGSMTATYTEPNVTGLGFTSLSPINGITSSGTISLTWSTVTGAASYAVVYGTGSTPANCSSGTVVSGTQTVSGSTVTYDTGLSAGGSTNYYFKVCAVSSTGVLASGSTTTFTPAFVSTWDTTKTGTSNSYQITLPLVSGGTYNFVVDWADGSTNTITTYNNSNITHTYATSGIKTVSITGTLIGWAFANAGDKLKITNISQWGPFNLGTVSNYSASGGGAFYGASNLTVTAKDLMDLTGVTNLNGLFYGCSSLTSVPNINSWNVANITSLGNTFRGTAFNSDISSWNTASVTVFGNLFYGNSAFNQNIGGWNTANGTSLNYMFSGATAFNQNIGSWNTAKVTTMNYVFQGATAFNQNINSWNTANVTSMSGMFYGASAFNQNIGSWNTVNVTSMAQMFYGASAFNQNIGSWNTVNVTSMIQTFWGTTAFNGDIGSWNTTNVTNMIQMFLGAAAFNKNIGSWNTANVTNMDGMFLNATAFNQNIGSWATSRVTNMTYMFQATAFNQNLSSWNVINVTDMNGIFNSAALSRTNYDSILLGWSAQNVKTGVTFVASPTKYSLSSSVVSARATLTNAVASGGKAWTIWDGGGQATTPGAPTNLAGTSGNAQVALTWTAPSDNGGASISNYYYKYSSDSGSTWSTPALTGSSSASYTVTGLTNGTAYIFQVAAVNSAGTGSYSTSSGSVTPATTPGAPTSVSGTSGNAQVALTWTAPASTGGASITNYYYKYSSNSGSTWSTPALTGSSSASYTVTGLTNGTSYIFQVAAVNSAGTGSYSTSSASVSPTAPTTTTTTTIAATAPTSAPTLTGYVTSFTSGGQIWYEWDFCGTSSQNVSFTPGGNGGSAITNYQWSAGTFSGGTYVPTTWNDFSPAKTASPVPFTGLSDSNEYWYFIRAKNAIGTGPTSAVIYFWGCNVY